MSQSWFCFCFFKSVYKLIHSNLKTLVIPSLVCCSFVPHSQSSWRKKCNKHQHYWLCLRLIKTDCMAKYGITDLWKPWPRNLKVSTGNMLTWRNIKERQHHFFFQISRLLLVCLRHSCKKKKICICIHRYMYEVYVWVYIHILFS